METNLPNNFMDKLYTVDVKKISGAIARKSKIQFIKSSNKKASNSSILRNQKPKKLVQNVNTAPDKTQNTNLANLNDRGKIQDLIPLRICANLQTGNSNHS